MYKLLGGLKDYFKLQDIQTDNAVFRLHNIFTTVLLLTCSLIITATQYVGQPISCIVNGFVAHIEFYLAPPWGASFLPFTAAGCLARFLFSLLAIILLILLWANLFSSKNSIFLHPKYRQVNNIK